MNLVNLVSCGVVCGVFLSSLGLSDEYIPKETPPLHQQNEHVNSSALVLGASVGIGQTYVAGPGDRPDVAVLAEGEVALQIAQGLWQRVTPGAKILVGQLKARFDENGGHSQLTIPVKFGAMADLSLGWAIGPNTFWNVTAGLGLAGVGYEVESDGSRIKASETLLSRVGRLGTGAVLGLGRNFDLLGNVNLTHFSFDAESLESGGQKISGSRLISVNVPQVEIGLRIRI